MGGKGLIMQYGQGFWVVENGMRLKDRSLAYPSLRGFEYGDGDFGHFLLKPFAFDYVKPNDGSGQAWRITISGDPNPLLHFNSFDFDGASVPHLKIVRMMVRDKLDPRWQVASLGHDLGYCVHEYVMGFTRSDWDELLSEIAEAYGESAYYRGKYRLAVNVAGWACYKKTPEELAIYRSLVKIERVPL